MTMKVYKISRKNRITLMLFRWIEGWLKIIEGLISVISLGIFYPSWHINVLSEELLVMFRKDNWQ